MLEVINGNLLDCDAKYIAHQCNCISINSAYLAKDIFAKFPWSDVYRPREFSYSDVPGTSIIKGNGTDQRYVIGLMGQLYPGPPVKRLDSKKDRLRYFVNSLKEINHLNDIAFPFGIGCGAAKGDWDDYFKILKNFSCNKNVRIVKYV